MIISRQLAQPCPRCARVGLFGNVWVRNNEIFRGCNACQLQAQIPLPELRKSILYLDQNFLSAAFKQRDRRYVDAAARITDLAHQQLVVCPWSPLHETETSLWSSDQQQKLMAFIKSTARGHCLKLSESVKEEQLVRAFRSYVATGTGDNSLNASDVHDCDLHHWDNYVWVDVRHPVDSSDVDRTKRGKEQSAKALADIFPVWRDHPATFAEDVAQEARGYGQTLFNLYIDSCRLLGEGNIESFLLAPVESQVIRHLRDFAGDDLPMEEQLKLVSQFLLSEHFAKVPYLDASCRLFAVLRKRVRAGAFPDRDKAAAALRGLAYDIDAASVYAPYCDAVFLDREMRLWSIDPECALPARYGFELFSTDTWQEFHTFLDKVETAKPPHHSHFMRLAYP